MPCIESKQSAAFALLFRATRGVSRGSRRGLDLVHSNFEIEKGTCPFATPRVYEESIALSTVGIPCCDTGSNSKNLTRNLNSLLLHLSPNNVQTDVTILEGRSRMQVIGICRFSYPAEGGFQRLHESLEERCAYMYEMYEDERLNSDLRRSKP